MPRKFLIDYVFLGQAGRPRPALLEFSGELTQKFGRG